VSKNSVGVNVYQNATLNPGEVNTVSKDIVLPIAKLKLTGAVVTPGGSPVPNATITVTGSRYQTMTADSTGTYSSQDIEINASQTQTLQYKIRAGSATVERTVTIAPTALAELTQTENFIFDDTGPGSTVWSFTNPDSYTLNTPILAADGSIYVYSANGKVHAVNPDGSLRWTADVSASGLPMVGPNNVLYVPSGSSLIALNADGGTRWRYSGASTINAMAFANDGTIYLGSNRLVALDSSGAERWQNTSLTPTGNTVQSLIIRSDGSLAVVAGQYAQSTLYVLNPDGSTRWQTGGFQNSSQYGLIPGQDGAVFVIRSNGVTAFEEDGTQRWSTNIDDYYDGIYPIGSLGSDGKIYVLSTRYYWGAYGSIKAINTQTGSINTIQVGDGYTAQLSIASNGAVLITLGTKFISLKDGVAQWTAESLNGNSFGDQPVVTSNGLVLVTAGSSLYAIRGDSLTGLDSSGWAHSRGNAQGTNQAPYVAPAPTRQVKLSGLVVDQNATSEIYVGAKVQIKDAGGKTLCRTTSSGTGAYTCNLNLTQSEQTTLSIIAKPANVASTYPETSIDHTVAAGAIGSSLESTVNAQIRSTRLKVNGLITNASGQPLANVDVSLDYGYYSSYYGSGYNSSYGSSTTNANGEYSVVVNDMATGALPSDLTVRVSKTDFGPQQQAVTGTVVADQQLQRTVNFSLTSKTKVTVHGVVRDANNLALSGASVQIQTFRYGTYGPYLQTFSSTSTNSSGEYSLDYDTFDTDFSLRVLAAYASEEDLKVLSFTANTLAPGAQTDITLDLSFVPPPTTTIAGTVLDTNGLPVRNAEVNLFDAALQPYPIATVSSGEDGTYTANVQLRTSGTQVRAQVSYGDFSADKPITLTMVGGVLTPQGPTNFAVTPSTRITITGILKDQAGNAMGGVLVRATDFYYYYDNFSGTTDQYGRYRIEVIFKPGQDITNLNLATFNANNTQTSSLELDFSALTPQTASTREIDITLQP
jgi:protocatechuate 3,4-dioxygenase beta subunit